MPPALTEAWAIAYLQILIAFMLFMFGLRAVIFQIALSEEIRQLVGKRIRPYAIAVLLPIVIMTGCFVWSMHSFSSERSTSYMAWFAAVSMTFVIGLVILLWPRIIRCLSKASIVAALKKHILADFRKRGTLDEELLTELIGFGKGVEAGYEKNLVLSGIDDICQKVQASDIPSGDRLVSLLRKVLDILDNSKELGNRDNFAKASSILTDTLKRFGPGDGSFAEGNDALAVFNALEKLSESAARRNFDSVLRGIIEDIDSAKGYDKLKARVYLQIGLTGLGEGSYPISIEAFSKLETAALQETKLEVDSAIDLIGLLACFWTSDSGSAKRKAKQFIDDNRTAFSPSLDECLAAAQEDFYFRLRFDVADKIEEMRQNLNSQG